MQKKPWSFREATREDLTVKATFEPRAKESERLLQVLIWGFPSRSKTNSMRSMMVTSEFCEKARVANSG